MLQLQLLWLQPLLLFSLNCFFGGSCGAKAEFWDSDFVNTLYSFVRYKGYFVSLFQHATKPNYFFYSPLVVLDKDSGQVFNNYLRGMYEIDFNVVMSTDSLRNEVLQHLTNSKQVQSPQVQLIPMETVRFTYASALRRGGMKLDLESTSVPNNHLPNLLPIKFYSFSENEAKKFLAAVQQHPAILDQVVLEYTIMQRRTAEKQVEIKAEYIASTRIFAQLSTMTAPGTIRYLTAHDANLVAGQSFSSISARVVRSQEYIEGPDEIRLTQIVEQLLTRDATRWSQLDEVAQKSVFWDPAFAKPDEVSHLLNRVYERDSGSSRLLKVREDEKTALEQQSTLTTACYVFQCVNNSVGTGRRLSTKERLSEDQMTQFLNERQMEVEYTGQLFVVKNMQLYRVNTAEFQGGQTIATSSVQISKKQEIHSLKLKTDSELPDESDAVSQAACSNSPYAYKGCYEDSDSARDLSGFSQQTTDMNVGRCHDLCTERGFAYFGLQAGDFCYCGATYGRYQMRPDAECDTRCLGDSGQRCGGRQRNSIFGINRAAASSVAPQTPPQVPTSDNVYNSSKYEYRGCYSSLDGNQQPWLMEQSDQMSVEVCYDTCLRKQQQLAAWFGVRAGSECHCRQKAPRLRRLSEGECRSACAGDSRQLCGGPAAVSLYALASLREGVQEQKQTSGNPAFSDFTAELAAASAAGSSRPPVAGASGARTTFRELGCPTARDAFIELSAFQTPSMVAADCADFCRTDDPNVKYFRAASGGGASGGGGGGGGGGLIRSSSLGAFGSGGFGGGDENFGCACLYTMMPEARIGFGTGKGNCGGYKYYAIEGR